MFSKIRMSMYAIVYACDYIQACHQPLPIPEEEHMILN